MLARIAVCAAMFLISPACFGMDLSAVPEGKPIASLGARSPRDLGDQQEASAPGSAAAATLPISRAGPAIPGAALPQPGPTDREPFGLESRPLLAGDIVSKWKGVEAEIRADNQILDRCRQGASCPPAAREFLAIIGEGAKQSGLARVGVINRAINLAIKPTSDLEQWGVPDHWSSPLETFTTHRGDCEDYAIAKYVALKAIGFADEDVRLVLVRDVAIEENHAIVTVRVNDGWIILDNRWLALVQDREMWRATPLAVLDETCACMFLSAPESPVGQLKRRTPGSPF
jgi:predicted transglutaminase-like cysteine proteinase